jgi:hypothetical protein
VRPFDLCSYSVFEALHVIAPTGYSWFGEPDEDNRALLMSSAEAEEYLATRIQIRLYSDFYVHGTPRPGPAYQVTRPVTEPTGLVDRLRHANTGRYSTATGWSMVGRDGDRYVVERDGLKLWVRLSEILEGHSDSGRLSTGEAVTLRLSPHLLRLSPGFYSTQGESAFELKTTSMLIRVYWHVDAASAEHLVAAVTEVLNHARIPFRLKVANRTDRFDRADGGVLYLLSHSWPDAMPLLRVVHSRVGPLQANVPAYTKRLAAGVGLAEDPGGGVSFGMSRCRLLADAVLRNCREEDAVEDRAEAVALYFASRGVDPDRPWLRTGARDRYPPWDAEVAERP